MRRRDGRTARVGSCSGRGVSSAAKQPMKRMFAVALGILTAIGGVLDIGDLVTNAVVGSRFGLSMAWAVVVGVVEICVFRSDAGAGGGRERAGDIRARSRHKAVRRCWADTP